MIEPFLGWNVIFPVKVIPKDVFIYMRSERVLKKRLKLQIEHSNYNFGKQYTYMPKMIGRKYTKMISMFIQR